MSATSHTTGLRYEDFARCVHCGLCLNSCPTYRLWQLEADSPRGRIRQMVEVEQNGRPLTAHFVEHIDKCLDCRSCETACPSGVEYGKLVEHSRERIEAEFKRPWPTRMARAIVFRGLLPYPGRIRMLGRLVRFYQSSGLQGAVRRSGGLKMLGLAEREQLLPQVDETFFYEQYGKVFPAQGERRARVAFFAGCIANVTFSKLNEATIRVLTASGCDVVVPARQECCGALAGHAGVADVAKELARKNLGAFELSGIDAIVTNAAGCGSTLKEYPLRFADRDAERGTAEAFRGKVRDVTEFLVELGVKAPMQRLECRVTYQDSCHLLHGQRVKEAPRQLLRAIPGVELVELPFSEICCGSAGVYNVTQTEASLELLAEKMANAAKTKADVIATANPGCLLQMRAGAELRRTGQRVLHVVELLDEAISGATA